MTELARQRGWIDECTAANATCRQELNRECTAHAHTRGALAQEKQRRAETEMMLAHKQQHLLTVHAARLAAEDSLLITRQQCQELAAELDHTQRKFQLVDSIVDVALLEEDSQLDLPDRSRQITDVIFDLERQMEVRYRDDIKRKEMRIEQLELSLTGTGSSANESVRDLRAQSEPVFALRQE
jgi:hypothetical protein